MAVIQDLPVELFARICSFLCFHCQAPRFFPNADMEELLADKASLARLCRVSKSVCGIAQPFVFHYYATGNLPWYYHCGPEDPTFMYSDARWPCANDFLPSFLRSIIRRPDLAGCVRALQLVTPKPFPEQCLPWDGGLEADCESAITKASTDLGVVAFNGFHPGYKDWVRNMPGFEDWVTIDDIHHTLVQLAILLCPQVRTLLLMGDFSPSSGSLLLSSGRALPALETIGLISNDGGGHYNLITPLIALAPNLQTIHAIDAHNETINAPVVAGRAFGPPPFRDGPFTTLRKAVIQNLGADDLSAFLRSAPALHELSYTESHETDDEPGPEYYRDLVAGLARTHPTLRRLSLRFPVALTILPRRHSFLPPAIGSLSGFVRLEELSVSQGAIYSRHYGGPPLVPLAGGLVEFLPPSLVALSILEVCRDFEADLRCLARDALGGLPRLRSVRIVSFYTDEPCNAHLVVFSGEEKTNELQSVFAAAGISLAFAWADEDDGVGDVPGLPTAERSGTDGCWKLGLRY
ncbi:uncharacterized protein B0H64DRAFT_369116 [Chaetomium fimeti]|uniref:Uncharacterized protein n=1 Tax=Chaetomium fimeti TaxID=1854472 RepID=A0AAE0HQ97_9PEZI|nr:hypothetical protein B0H64DRAFT_369116 [Chaetomium fimeti]